MTTILLKIYKIYRKAKATLFPPEGRSRAGYKSLKARRRPLKPLKPIYRPDGQGSRHLTQIPLKNRGSTYSRLRENFIDKFAQMNLK